MCHNVANTQVFFALVVNSLVIERESHDSLLIKAYKKQVLEETNGN